MPEETTTTVESSQEQRHTSAWVTPKRAVIGVIVLIVSVGFAMGVLHDCGITAESTGDVVCMAVLAVIGVGAGVVGADLRKKQQWQTALTAYRVAVWCLFLAFWTALQFHRDVKREEVIRRINEKVQQIEQGAKQTGP